MDLKEIKELFKDIDESKMKLLEPIMEETVFIKEQLDMLKKLPLIRIHPEHPDIQKRTEAGKMLKEYEQTFNNNMKILLSTLNSSDISDENPILMWLKGKEE